jgi:hypothetical protein
LAGALNAYIYAMKYTVILTLIACMACNTPSQKQETKSPQNLDWILGEWVRTNGELNENSYENWTKTNNGYAGAAYTLVEGDTVFQESIRAYMEGTQWRYEVSGPNEKPITFTSTSVTDTSFICENVAHDFPKVIAYSKDGDCINATISDGGAKEVLFRYERRVR